jgi:uncharacterized protein YcfL
MKTVFLTLSVLFFLAGCADKSYVKFVDNSIGNYIEIQKINKRVRPNGFIEIEVVGENSTKYSKLFRYRVTWEDKDGFEIPSISSNWREFSAQKNAQFRISVIAPNKKAVIYQLYVDKLNN